MACSLKTGFYISGVDEISNGSKSKGVSGFCSSFGFPHTREPNSRHFPVLYARFMGKHLLVSDQKGFRDLKVKTPRNFSVHVCKILSPFFFFFCNNFQFFKKFFFFFLHLHFWGLSKNFIYQTLISGTSIDLCKQRYEMVGKDHSTQYGGDPFCPRACKFFA